MRMTFLIVLVLVLLWIGLIDRDAQHHLQRLGRFDNEASHVLGFFVISVSAFYAFGLGIWSFLFLVCLALLTEAAQIFIPARSASALDLLFNLLGIGIAIVVWRASIALGPTRHHK